MTLRDPGTDDDLESIIDDAVRRLRHGGLVAIPTETVYGLAADASNEPAVRRIFTTKGRPADHPLIVHLADAAELDRWCVGINPAARALAAAFWPGPLTLVLRRQARVLDDVTGGRDTVAVRVPAHAVALEILDRFDGGLAAPSANLFGQVSPTTAAHVRADLGDQVDLVVDGGPCAIGVESTIVEVLDEPRLLRLGAITTDDLQNVLATTVGDGRSGPVRAPGMLASHYAPVAQVLLAKDRDHAEALATGAPGPVEILDPDGDVHDWARGLYGWLRALDARGARTIVVVTPVDAGLGAAVNDRLRKAAHPR